MRKRDRLYRSRVVWSLLVAALVSQALVSRPAGAQQPQEQELMQATNADRAARGLGPLAWDPALAEAATAHAQLMVEQPALSHQYPREPDLATRAGEQGAHFRSIAENIAVGPSPQAIEEEWMHSTAHRTNILDPRMNAIGIGMVKRGGNYYAVEDFSDSIPQLGPEQIEQKVGQLLQEQGIQPTGPVRDARQTCEMQHGVAGGSAPRFVMRWEGTDLSRLPAPLLQQLQSGRYRTAAVGACDSGHPGQGFTTYHIAVMLY